MEAVDSVHVHEAAEVDLLSDMQFIIQREAQLYLTLLHEITFDPL